MRDYALETTFDIKFTTRRFTTGVPFALASGVISAYPGNSITQITAGITLTADFDGVVGLNNIRVVATAANGYATNTNYALVITTGTVDSVSVVGEVVGEFSIEAQSPLRPTVAARTLDVSVGGEAGLDWANIGSPTTAQNLSATNIDVDQVVASVSGAVGSVTGLTAATVHSDLDDIQARLPAALSAGGNMKSDVLSLGGVVQSLTDLKDFADDGYDPATNKVQGVVLVDTITTYTGNTVQTGDSFARIGVAGAGLTNIDLPNQTMDITGNITGNLSGSVGSVTGAVGSVTGNVGGNVTGTIGGLTAAALKDFFDTDTTTTYASAVAGSVVKEIADNAGGSSLTAADIADAVWDEAIAGHLSAGSTGEALSDDAVLASIAALNDLSQADIRTAVGLASANLDTQLADLPTTAELATALGTADDAVLAAIAALNNLSQANIRTAVGLGSANLDTQLDALPTNAELAVALAAADDAVLAAIGALNNLSAAAVNAEVVDALNVDTYAEPTGVPAATASLVSKIGRLHQALRNAITVTATAKTFQNDAGATLWTKALSDDGVTYTEGEGG
jgi:hypothetical protein